MLWGHKRRETVFVGLSGGVDSAVSAALLRRQGYRVIGVFIRIALPGYPCSAGEDRREALRVATHLKIPFREIDLTDAYQKRVFIPSIEAFAQGKTPNPDAWCNREIKFGLFYEYAREQGAHYIATGHYARALHTKNGMSLYMGKDSSKDQSYFLWTISQEQLAHALFPVGSLQKTQVRRYAHQFGLPNAERKDSQGLCFVGNLRIEEILSKERLQQKGKVVDDTGSEIGEHEGAMLYTIGQRHGFTLFSQTPHSVPHFVVSKDVVHNTITVSPHQTPLEYSKTRITLVEDHWIEGIPKEQSYMVRYRYRQPLIPATLHQEGNRTIITLLEPHLVPEGQSLVVYEGARCLGGGVVNTVELLSESGYTAENASTYPKG